MGLGLIIAVLALALGVILDRLWIHYFGQTEEEREKARKERIAEVAERVKESLYSIGFFEILVTRLSAELKALRKQQPKKRAKKKPGRKKRANRGRPLKVSTKRLPRARVFVDGREVKGKIVETDGPVGEGTQIAPGMTHPPDAKTLPPAEAPPKKKPGRKPKINTSPSSVSNGLPNNGSDSHSDA